MNEEVDVEELISNSPPYVGDPGDITEKEFHESERDVLEHAHYNGVDTVTVEFTEEQATALLQYTDSNLFGERSCDCGPAIIERCCGKLLEAIGNDGLEE